MEFFVYYYNTYVPKSLIETMSTYTTKKLHSLRLHQCPATPGNVGTVLLVDVLVMP